MGGVPLTFLAMAAGAAAAPLDQDQRGRQDRTVGLKLFEPGFEMAADERGMFGDLKRGTCRRARGAHDGYV